MSLSKQNISVEQVKYIKLWTRQTCVVFCFLPTGTYKYYVTVFPKHVDPLYQRNVP